MIRFRYIPALFLLALSFVVLMPCHAYAYIDPGTGSYVLQILIAGLVGASFTIKLFGKRIKLFLSGLFSKNKDSKKSRVSGDDE